MRCRQLGSSPLQVSEISLGSWLTYGVGVERDVGASRPEQLDDNVGAVGREVDPALFARTEAILADLTAEGS